MTSTAETGITLALRGARYAHPHSPPVFSNLDFAIGPGDKLALLGANGSGKTTLLRLLVGLCTPQAGELILDGQPVGRSSSERTRLRSAVQLVLQEPDDQVFSASVYADVSFGPVNMGLDATEVEQRVDAALESLGITDLAPRAPHMLSFGQRKRVALAGVLAMRPRVLLLDEPTAGLDAAATADLLATLDRLAAEGVGIVMATHEVDTAWAWSTDVALLSAGTVTRGATHRLLASSAALAAAGLAKPWGGVIKNKWNRTILSATELEHVTVEPVTPFGKEGLGAPYDDRGDS